jgi:phage virion morphogenesis protein
MPEAFAVQIDDREIRAALQRTLAATGNLTPVMKAIGERLVRSTEERFDTETAPDGTPWKPLKATTLYGSYKKKKSTKAGEPTAAFSRYLSGRKILTLSGELRGSIFSKPGQDQVAVGTGKIYGATHQFGRGKIPARPFLGITDADRNEILELLREHIEHAMAEK